MDKLDQVCVLFPVFIESQEEEDSQRETGGLGGGSDVEAGGAEGGRTAPEGGGGQGRDGGRPRGEAEGGGQALGTPGARLE